MCHCHTARIDHLQQNWVEVVGNIAPSTQQARWAAFCIIDKSTPLHDLLWCPTQQAWPNRQPNEWSLRQEMKWPESRFRMEILLPDRPMASLGPLCHGIMKNLWFMAWYFPIYVSKNKCFQSKYMLARTDWAAFWISSMPSTRAKNFCRAWSPPRVLCKYCTFLNSGVGSHNPLMANCAFMDYTL